MTFNVSDVKGISMENMGQPQSLPEFLKKQPKNPLNRWAVVGGLSDGSSGARRGAKVGVGAAVLSGANQAEIPAGTLLEFTLIENLQLQAQCIAVINSDMCEKYRIYPGVCDFLTSLTATHQIICNSQLKTGPCD